jgi:hypothetical protein
VRQLPDGVHAPSYHCFLRNAADRGSRLGERSCSFFVLLPLSVSNLWPCMHKQARSIGIIPEWILATAAS